MPKPLTVWTTTNSGKFLKMWEYQTTWPASWEICMQVKKQVRTGHGTTDWFQIGKGVHQGCILSPCLFNLYAQYIMWNARLDEAQAGIKTAGRNINNLRYPGDTTLGQEDPWRRKWLPTIVFLPGEFHGEAWKATVHGDHKELDTTEWRTLSFFTFQRESHVYVFLFLFCIWGHHFCICLFKGLSIICHRRGYFFIVFFCLSPLSKISQSHMGRSTSRLFIPFCWLYV